MPDEIYRRASYRDIWLNLIPSDVYKEGTGIEQSTFTIGRSEPTSDCETWDLITLSSGEVYTGSCNTTYNDTSIGFNEVLYHPEQFGLKGPVICQDDLIFNFHADRFLEAYIQELTKRAKRSYGNRFLNIYSHFVPKWVANADFTQSAGGTGDPPDCPDLTLDQSQCNLTQEMLDVVAANLNEEGASDANSNGWINLGDDGPIYPLYIGQLASQAIQLNNAELRQDYRYAEPMALIKRIGASRVIRNFRHVINLFPPRYNYEGGAYVRVPTWVNNTATKGLVADVNPAWRNADFEAAFVLNPWVFHSEKIRPVNSAAGLSWSVKNYMGEWQFVAGGKEITDAGAACYDPLKKLGRHFAEYKHAPRPIFPQYGAMILFQICPTSVTCVSCS